jgi:hypothetical protein
MGLGKTMLDAETRPTKRGDELLEELKSLTQAHPEDDWGEQFGRSAGVKVVPVDYSPLAGRRSEGACAP